MSPSERIILHFPQVRHSIELPDELHPVLRRVYANRALSSAEELERGLKAIPPVSSLGGVSQAADLLQQALEQQAKILVVADFDADGATSCALAVRALRAMGASQVGYLVPNRFEYGYGLTPEIVAEALKRSPDLLITVDNGISSLRGVAAAKAAGVSVLVTDHHLPGAELPAADVIVNPNCAGDPFPSKNLAGVGVIFYVLAALRARLREQGWFRSRGIAEPNLADYLDLVALGTVADVVPLDHVNRILVYQGLQRIRAGKCCTGVKALIEVAGRNHQQLVSSDLGFAVGPRLNAAGRLEDMSLGIECLLTDDPFMARDMARQLDTLNHERRAIEQQMQRAANEEFDHLAWCEERLTELGAAPSRLSPFWYAGAFAIGAASGVLGDRWSLGFVAETEKQVEGHLDEHLEQLAPEDAKTRVILEQMKADEIDHGEKAMNHGGVHLPLPIRAAMKLTAKIMTTTVYRL